MRKKFFLVLLFLVLGLLFYQTVMVRPSCWDGQSRITFVLTSRPVVVASFEPGKNLPLIGLPENLYLEVPHGFGQYQLGSVYQLGELEKKGGKLLKETVQGYLGVPVDGYIKIQSSNKVQNDKKFILNCLILGLRGGGETDLSHWDLLRLWWQIKRVRSDKVALINLEETNILTKKTLADGSEVLETEFFRLDEVVKKYFADSKIEKEAINLEILNATQHSGLANRLARLMNNLGASVISVSNADTQQLEIRLIVRDELTKKSYTVQKLEKILEIKTEVGEMAGSRADLLISVGEDYWERVK